MTASPLAARARRVEFEAYARRADRRDEALRKAKVKPFETKIGVALLGRWRTTCDAEGFNAATRELNHTVRSVMVPMIARAPESLARFHADRIAQRDVLDQHAGDAKVRAWSARRAGEAANLRNGYDGDDDAFSALVTYTGGFGIEPARPLRPDDPVYVAGAVRRMCAAKWWRRQARRSLTRRIERAEVFAGRVHCRAGVYLSDRNVRRGVEAAQRNADMLAATEAVNENGEVFNLGELAEKSLSNPRIAFAEMMVRVKGLEQIADDLGWSGTFETLTLASRFHPRLSKSGAINPKWTEGLGAREGQGALCKMWAKVRSTLRRLGVEYFGLRVAEPHHDGTPHWHMLIWAPLRALGVLRDTLRRFALQDSPDEPGAQQYRYKSETIDKAKGSAAGYLVKYVAKNTAADGLERALDTDDEGRDYDIAAAADGALRARLWARAHGIRQFQFFGAPPVGIYREFRRLREPVTADEKPTWGPAQLDLFESARASADESRYGDFVRACGGIAGRRFVLAKEDAGANVYGEPGGRVTKGICFAAGGTPVVTRVHEWTILQGAKRSEVAAPWTRVSNCNGGEKPRGVDDDDEEETGPQGGQESDEARSAIQRQGRRAGNVGAPGCRRLRRGYGEFEASAAEHGPSPSRQENHAGAGR